ncbi:retinoid-inducible serine carboxypeptidase [Ambystoma mexicanum]|uniref:retinoid-inducible serine carboxypeptidase n=1 Tax=Ambystoma mexicanum TaxID=8296 RepID=UPI0037E74258
MGSLVLLLSLATVSAGAVIGKVGEEKEAWGYVPVRSNAYMFWWLYYANNPTKSFAELPLVMWLQGGPGASGCGYGNFEEIGPLDSDLKPRNTTWVREASVLFVDNPVGTGFSYTNDSEAYAKDIDTVASDMLVLLKVFFNSHPEFQSIPFHIFSESYGGKMAAAVSFELQKAVQAGSIKCNFSGAALGDSWISPLDSVLSWGPYLYSTSLLDDEGLGQVTAVAKQVMDAINRGKYKDATDLWSQTEDVIEENTDGVNFYNILTKDSSMAKKSFVMEDSKFGSIYLAKLYHHHVKPLHSGDLSSLMNGPIRKKLHIIPDSVKWGGQARDVFENMAEDFMKPVIDIVDMLLAANVSVTVYNGQLDLIVDTVGQEMWLRKLKWPQMEQFRKLKWKPLHVSSAPAETAAFYKSYENLAFYWILRAGHMVPSDQADMALKMLRMVTHQE